MNFYPLTKTEYKPESLKMEYKSGREIGRIRLGTGNLFFKNGWRTYFIPYTDIKRCFRRVMMVPARLCCGRGDLPVENLVIWDSERELAQIQLPGTKAARVLMDELKLLIPDAEFCRPPEKEAEEESSMVKASI